MPKVLFNNVFCHTPIKKSVTFSLSYDQLQAIANLIEDLHNPKTRKQFSKYPIDTMAPIHNSIYAQAINAMISLEAAQEAQNA